MKLSRAFLLIAGIICATPVWAYGPTGHQIVGGIADEKLANTPTGKKVAEMLDGFTLQKAAVIPDEIKGWDKKGPDDPGIFHYSARPRIDEQLRAFWHANPPTNDPNSPIPSHHWFHYTDVPVADAEKYSDGKVGRSEWDIVHMMRYCIAVLHGDKPAENERKITKPIAIILLAHYVGDLHQPLHVGAEYFDATGKPMNPDKNEGGIEDQGGNTITLQLPTGKKKLHGFWDNDAVYAMLPEQSAAMEKEERRAASDTAMNKAIQDFATQEPKDWKLPAGTKLKDYPEAWANQILPMAREAHQRLQFQAMHAHEQDGKTFDFGTAIEKPEADKVSYRDWAGGVVKTELHLAGWRLAELLEKCLKDSPETAEPSPSASIAPASIPVLTPTPSPSASAAGPQLATIVKPVTIQIQYGSIQLPAGMKLPYIMLDSSTVRVRYLGVDYDVPRTSTDVPAK